MGIHERYPQAFPELQDSDGAPLDDGRGTRGGPGEDVRDMSDPEPGWEPQVAEPSSEEASASDNGSNGNGSPTRVDREEAGAGAGERGSHERGAPAPAQESELSSGVREMEMVPPPAPPAPPLPRGSRVQPRASDARARSADAGRQWLQRRADPGVQRRGGPAVGAPEAEARAPRGQGGAQGGGRRGRGRR